MLAPAAIIRLEDDAVVLLDQTLLPAVRRDRRCDTVDQLIAAIAELAVRGAPLLGVAGAMGVWLASLAAPEHPQGLRQYVAQEAERIATARPTAVNLRWGVSEALRELERPWTNIAEARGRLRAVAERVHRDEVARCRAIGAHGGDVLGSVARVITQCNAGGLATGGYGTALGVIAAVSGRVSDLHVWVPETRPLLQGARLTAFELAEAGIAHTVVTDNACAALFAEGSVDAVVVGADRIAVNGDTANKIGTYALAVLAHHHDVPFYVAAPTTTIDPSTATGASIVIEQRAASEVTTWSPARNDAFDVTPAALITAIVTERGVLRRPFQLADERP
jgi:methylthioribose-1-phosphate isomerase